MRFRNDLLAHGKTVAIYNADTPLIVLGGGAVVRVQCLPSRDDRFQRFAVSIPRDPVHGRPPVRISLIQIFLRSFLQDGHVAILCSLVNASRHHGGVLVAGVAVARLCEGHRLIKLLSWNIVEHDSSAGYQCCLAANKQTRN